MAGGLSDPADPILAVGSPSELAVPCLMSPLLPRPWNVLVWGVTYTGPPPVGLAQSSGSWGEWPLPGPSLGGAGVGGAFFTRLFSPRILSPSLWCRSAAAPAPVPRQLGIICPGASRVCSGLSPPCTEEETNEARVRGWGWSHPHRTPAPGLSSQDQGREEGWEVGP